MNEEEECQCSGCQWQRYPDYKILGARLRMEWVHLILRNAVYVTEMILFSEYGADVVFVDINYVTNMRDRHNRELAKLN